MSVICRIAPETGRRRRSRLTRRNPASLRFSTCADRHATDRGAIASRGKRHAPETLRGHARGWNRGRSPATARPGRRTSRRSPARCAARKKARWRRHGDGDPGEFHHHGDGDHRRSGATPFPADRLGPGDYTLTIRASATTSTASRRRPSRPSRPRRPTSSSRRRATSSPSSPAPNGSRAGPAPTPRSASSPTA